MRQTQEQNQIKLSSFKCLGFFSHSHFSNFQSAKKPKNKIKSNWKPKNKLTQASATWPRNPGRATLAQATQAARHWPRSRNLGLAGLGSTTRANTTWASATWPRDLGRRARTTGGTGRGCCGPWRTSPERSTSSAVQVFEIWKKFGFCLYDFGVIREDYIMVINWGLKTQFPADLMWKKCHIRPWKSSLWDSIYRPKSSLLDSRY